MEQHTKAVAIDAAGIGVLITDTERFATQGDKVVSRVDLLKALKLPLTPSIVHNEEWDWLAAPHADEHPTHDYLHAVVGKVYQRGTAEEAKTEGAPASVPLPPELEAELQAEKGDPLGDIIPRR